MGPLLRQPAGQNRGNLRGYRNRIGFQSEVALNQGFRANSGARSPGLWTRNAVELGSFTTGARQRQFLWRFQGAQRVKNDGILTSWLALPGWKPSPDGRGRPSILTGFWPVRPAASLPHCGPAAAHGPVDSHRLPSDARARQSAGQRPAYPRSGSSSRRAQMPTRTARQSTTALSFDLPASVRKSPTTLRTRFAIASMRWYEPCNAKSSRCVDFARTVQTIVARND